MGGIYIDMCPRDRTRFSIVLARNCLYNLEGKCGRGWDYKYFSETKVAPEEEFAFSFTVKLHLNEKVAYSFPVVSDPRGHMPVNT